MARMNLHAVVIAVLMLSAPDWAQVQAAPPDSSFSSLDKSHAIMKTSYPGVTGLLKYDVSGRVVVISWMRDFLEQNSRELSAQEEPCSFWPTEVCSVGTNQVCVAGKNVKGFTVIRHWTFSFTEALEEPVTHSDGTIEFPDTFIPVASTSTAYQSNDSGRRLVRAMFGNHGKPGHVFVVFDDSRDLYELNLQTQSLALIQSRVGQPMLSMEFSNRTSWDHAQYGYLYHLASGRKPGDSDSSLIFVDADRDGVLDLGSTMLVSPSQWQTIFADGSLFLEQY